ncbi:Hypothetical protein A7982_00994 [Minicystis rosea]|nr:Hypothetical protein A7982_00994 [Minicystis rosea]
MRFDPYRTSTPLIDPPRPRIGSLPSYDVIVVAVVIWLLAVLRIACALWRHEPQSREIDVGWLLIVLLPIVVGKEIAAQRRR